MPILQILQMAFLPLNIAAALYFLLGVSEPMWHIVIINTVAAVCLIIGIKLH